MELPSAKLKKNKVADDIKIQQANCKDNIKINFPFSTNHFQQQYSTAYRFHKQYDSVFSKLNLSLCFSFYLLANPSLELPLPQAVCEAKITSFPFTPHNHHTSTELQEKMVMEKKTAFSLISFICRVRDPHQARACPPMETLHSVPHCKTYAKSR